MRNIYRTMLMAAAAVFITTGAYAEGYTKDGRAQMSVEQSGRLSNADVKDVQESLNDEGHNLSVDGIWGPNTTAAIRDFQRQNNLDISGNLDSETIAELNVDVDGSRDIW